MSEKMSLVADKKKMTEFLEFLFQGMKGYEDGLIEISDLTHSLFFKLDEIKSAVELSYEWNTAGKCVYTTGALIVPDIYERIEKRREEDRQSGKERPSYRATGNDFYASQVCWVDIDGVKDKAELKARYEQAPPNYISITSKTPELRTHLWWMLEKACDEPEKIEAVNIGLISHLGGDKGTHNRTRLMKIGGSVNWPSSAKAAKGRIAESVECGCTQWMPPHDIETLLSVYATQKEQAQLDVSQIHSPQVRPSPLDLSNDREKALEALYYIPADCDYDTWYKVAAAAKRAGISYSEFLQWSSTGGSKYEGPESVRRKWEQVSSITSINPGTLFYIAKEYGYEKIKRTELTTYSQQVQSVERFDPETGEMIEEPKSAFQIKDWGIKEKYIGEANEIEWLIEGVLPVGVPMMLAAMGGIGKSYKTLEMALRICSSVIGLTAQKVLGGNIVSFGNVAVLSAEDSYDSIHRRLNAIDPATTRLSAQHNAYIVPMSEIGGTQPLIKTTADGFVVTDFYHEMKAQLAEIDSLKLVVIDPLQAFVEGDISSSNEFAQAVFSRCLVPLAVELNATVLVVHHMNKDGGFNIRSGEDARKAIRGVTGLVDGGRGTYCLWNPPEDIRQLLCSVLGEEYEAERFVQGAMVKFNDQHNAAVTTYYREESGLLKDIGTVNTEGAKASGMTDEQRREALNEIDLAWRSGAPYMRHHNSAKYVISWLCKRFKITKPQANIQLGLWLNPAFGAEARLTEEPFTDAQRKVKLGLKYRSIS